MLGILVILAISWLLLYLFERKSILALGPLPARLRLSQFGLGFLVTALLCAGIQLGQAKVIGTSWTVNPNFVWSELWSRLYWNIKSVVTEELIFRGAVLHILIHRLGRQTGVIISAAAFGVYHWISFGILGNVMAMVFVFIGTGLMGYALALAFAKTRSLALPIGLHLGWNFILNAIYSNGPLGDGLLLLQSEQIVPSWYSLIGLCGAPLLVLTVVIWLIPDHVNKE